MRLINIATLELEEFFETPPPYAILSHTWEKGEVKLQDLERPGLEGKPGWIKIKGFCSIVKQHLPDVEYAWVDTCCIDKTSSAELSEAINSMFRYYQDSVCCFVYLVDVSGSRQDPSWLDFEKSRWFTRGFTLQELLAPRDLVFFDNTWTKIDSRSNLAPRISARTRIDTTTLASGDWSTASVARRMSWASSRQTTRPEDIAYCLLGIFNVNMPLLYGEGSKAFIRLQEEILKETDDYSIFAWDASQVSADVGHIGVLATHPSFFHDGGRIEAFPNPIPGHLSVTNQGIRVRLPLWERSPEAFIWLPCCFAGEYGMDSAVCLAVTTQQENLLIYGRTRSQILRVEFGSAASQPKSADVTFLKMNKASGNTVKRCWLRYDMGRLEHNLGNSPISVKSLVPIRTYPSMSWQINQETQSMTLAMPDAGDVETAVVFELSDSSKRFVVMLSMNPSSRRNGLQVLRVPDYGELPDTFKDFGYFVPQPIDIIEIGRGDVRVKAEIDVAVVRGILMFTVSCELLMQGLVVRHSPTPRRRIRDVLRD